MVHNHDHARVKWGGGAKIGSPPPSSCATESPGKVYGWSKLTNLDLKKVLKFIVFENAPI